jgi:hypothetical protein
MQLLLKLDKDNKILKSVNFILFCLKIMISAHNLTIRILHFLPEQ